MPRKRTPAERSKAKIFSEISSQMRTPTFLEKTLEASRSGARESNRDRPSDTVSIRRRTVREIHSLAPLLHVFDMPTSPRFYRNVLGFTVWGSCEPGDNYHCCGLRLHGAEVMLNTVYEAEYRPPAPDSAQVAARGYLLVFWLLRPRCGLPASACRRSQLEGTLGCTLRDEATLVSGIRSDTGCAFNDRQRRKVRIAGRRATGQNPTLPGQLAQAGFRWRLSK